MSKAITKNELVKLNSELSAKVAALGTALGDEKSLVAALRAKIVELSARPARFDSKTHLDTVRIEATKLVAQYGASNVMRVGGEFKVRTPNGAWHPVA